MRATECFSMNSDMSMRTIASSVSKRNSASALESSVLPTPVARGTGTTRSAGWGRRVRPASGGWRPRRPHGLVLPHHALRQRLFHPEQLFTLPSSIFETGMPVHLETTSAISSSVTLLRTRVGALVSASWAPLSRFSSSGSFPYCSSEARARSPARFAASSS